MINVINLINLRKSLHLIDPILLGHVAKQATLANLANLIHARLTRHRT